MAKYKYNANTQITPHFNSNEFHCKCGRNHDIEISDKLVTKLEELFKKLNCGKIIITSGYRCTQHDKTVGGSGNGQHTIGTAADIICYDKKDKIIGSKTVCCAAQLLGFTGVANIDNTYTATHVDVRNSGVWYGDEVMGSNYSIGLSFFKYYDIDKAAFNYIYPDNRVKVTVEIDDHTYTGLLEEI